MIWTLTLLIWSICCLASDLQLGTVAALVLLVDAQCFLTAALIPHILGQQFATTVEQSFRVLFTGILCTVPLYLLSQATTNAYITGMRESANCYYKSLKFHTNTCFRLHKSSATAHTKLSTKMSSDRYLDL